MNNIVQHLEKESTEELVSVMLLIRQLNIDHTANAKNAPAGHDSIINGYIDSNKIIYDKIKDVLLKRLSAKGIHVR